MKISVLAVLLVVCGCSPPGARKSKGAWSVRQIESGSTIASTADDPIPHRIPVVVGVLPFRNDTSDNSADHLGEALADEFSLDLASGGGLKVVERQRIKAALDELYFSDAYPVDETTAVKVGKLSGANVLALGNFSRTGGEIYLTVRLIKVETGEVLGGISEKGADLSSLHGSVRRAADEVFARLRGRF